MPTAKREFQLGILPEKKYDWRTFAASYGFVTACAAFLCFFGIFMPDTLKLVTNYHVTELIPRPALRSERIRKLPPKIQAKLLPPDPTFQTPKIIVPREVVTPKVKPQEVEAPKVTMNNFMPAALKVTAGGARPVLIHTGEFQGSSVTPTVNAPIQKVQTGGFGDPNGLKPSENSKANGKLIASAAGSFDMPVGQGQGNGSGGAKGIKGTVASANFGDGVATGGRGDGRSGGQGHAVQTSGFGTQEVAQNSPHMQRMDSGPASTGVEITDKPNPVYTAEAKDLKIEGEVLLEVQFSANGQLHVNRVVRGLGHGLDEAAVAAANKMRFKPATHSGQAVDSTAIVHVVFQLAY
jgi:TonB family protein